METTHTSPGNLQKNCGLGISHPLPALFFYFTPISENDEKDGHIHSLKVVVGDQIHVDLFFYFFFWNSEVVMRESFLIQIEQHTQQKSPLQKELNCNTRFFLSGLQWLLSILFLLSSLTHTLSLSSRSLMDEDLWTQKKKKRRNTHTHTQSSSDYLLYFV